MIEILTSPGFEIVISVLDIQAERTYCFTSNETSYWINGFEIWKVSESFIKDMNDFSDDEWNSLFPDQWWRSCAGTNLEDSDFKIIHFKINDLDLLCWENPQKIEDYIFEEEDGQEYVDDRPYEYSNILQYCSEEWDVGQPRNICAICVGLAKINHLSLGELFTKYMNGGDSNEKVS